MPNIGAPELIIILIVVLLLFGSTRLPKLARSLGEASREFKKGIGEGKEGAAQTTPAPDPNEPVTMTRAELDRLLAEREAAARKDTPPSS